MDAHGSPAPGQPVRAVLLDALGTLVELVDPYTALERELAARGAAADPACVRAALVAEMTFYRANCESAADSASLDALRDRCTEVLRDALPSPARGLPLPALREALLASLRFRAFPDAAPALEALRRAGLQLAIVSNWDVSLHAVLRDTGLVERVDAVITSAEVGAAKPAAAPFAAALRRLGVDPQEALHVGDDPLADLEGARAAGLRALLLERRPSVAGDAGELPGVSQGAAGGGDDAVIHLLTELPARLSPPPQAVP